MKKIVLALVVLVVSSPAWAVTITATGVADVCDPNLGHVTITYDMSLDTNDVRAYALDITLIADPNADKDPCVVAVSCVNGDYYVYPGTISIDSGGNVTDWGSCLCDEKALPGLDSNGVSVEMGSLYEQDVEDPPADTNVLVELTVSGCGTIGVDLELNAIRGGVVMENPDETPSVTLVDGSVTVGKECGWWYPPCWDYATQCHGDSDGDVDVDTVDWPFFRDGFGKSYPDGAYQPCADYDRDGDIDTVDWPEFRDNFGGVPAIDCPPGDLNEIYK